MKIKHSECLGASSYQTPTIEVLSILLEQSVLTESGSVYGVNGPEGYDVDDDVYIW